MAEEVGGEERAEEGVSREDHLEEVEVAAEAGFQVSIGGVLPFSAPKRRA